MKESLPVEGMKEEAKALPIKAKPMFPPFPPENEEKNQARMIFYQISSMYF